MQWLKRLTLVGVFPDVASARWATVELRRAGFTDNQIGIASRQRDEQGNLVVEKGSHWEEGAAIGALAGGALGAAGLAGAAAAGLMIPGFGPIFGAGVLLAALTGGGAGLIAGGVVGALIGMDIPEEEARFYEGELKGGRTLVTVRANGRQQEAWSILRNCGAYNWHERTLVARVESAEVLTALPADEAAAGARDIQVPVREEQLRGEAQRRVEQNPPAGNA